MRTVALAVQSNGSIKLVSGDVLARAGEKNATTLTVDVAEWAATLTTGVTYSIILKRSDEAAYPILSSATPTDGVLSVDLDDTASAVSGTVEVQVWAEKTNFLEKSDKYKLYITTTLESGSAPTGVAGWLESINSDYAAMFNATVRKGTTQTATLNPDGTIASIVYRDSDGIALRTDTFEYDGNVITEHRELASGYEVVVVYNLDTMEVTIS